MSTTEDDSNTNELTVGAVEAMPKKEIKRLSHILVVDDAPIIGEMIHGFLSGNSCTVTYANSSEAAIQEIARQTPDLIVLDVVMPSQDGLELYDHVKMMKGMQGVPVIFISGEATPNIRRSAFHKGAVDFVSKPFDLEEFRARVALHLRNQITSTELRQEVESVRKDNWGYMLAHDLLSPLTAVLGMTDDYLLQGKGLDREDVRCVHDCANRMKSIISSILELARAEGGRLDPEPVDVKSLVLDIITLNQAQLDSEQWEVTAPDEWPVCMGHPVLISQVWENLIGNALKYGADRKRIDLGWAEDSVGRLRFWVRDYGTGIPEDVRNGLFQQLTRSQRHDKLAGFGIGLSIVKRILDVLGGKCGVEAGEGGIGTKFYFVLSAAPEQTDAAAGGGDVARLSRP